MPTHPWLSRRRKNNNRVHPFPAYIFKVGKLNLVDNDQRNYVGYILEEKRKVWTIRVRKAECVNGR